MSQMKSVRIIFSLVSEELGSCCERMVQVNKSAEMECDWLTKKTQRISKSPFKRQEWSIKPNENRKNILIGPWADD